MKSICRYILFGLLAASPLAASAQFNFSRVLQGVVEATQAVTLTNDQVIAYVQEYIAQMDKENKVLPESDPRTQRLRRLTSGLNEVEGIPLNFKVYETDQVNAFACADGSVRVFTGLMDIMDDDQLLGVIGHEIGHVAHQDSKKAFKHALLTAAFKDGIASTSSRVAALTDSQLGALADALSSSHYSRKQETQADDYGYEFLKDHGKNPRAMAAAFLKMKEMEAAGGYQTSFINNLLSDHPDLDKRIANMDKRADKDHIPPLGTPSSYSAEEQQSKLTPAARLRSQKRATPAKVTPKASPAGPPTPVGEIHF